MLVPLGRRLGKSTSLRTGRSGQHDQSRTSFLHGLVVFYILRCIVLWLASLFAVQLVLFRLLTRCVFLCAGGC